MGDLSFLEQELNSEKYCLFSSPGSGGTWRHKVLDFSVLQSLGDKKKRAQSKVSVAAVGGKHMMREKKKKRIKLYRLHRCPLGYFAITMGRKNLSLKIMRRVCETAQQGKVLTASLTTHFPYLGPEDRRQELT